jgi:hypothetical protein
MPSEICRFKFTANLSGIYAKRAKREKKRRQRRGLLVFSELPNLPSAGSRSGCFYPSIGCTSRLENSKELQLQYIHEKFLFLTVLLLFAPFKMHYC